MPREERDTAIEEIDRGTQSDDSSSAFEDIDCASSHREKPPIDHANVQFEPGRNCWRVESAERTAFLIDGRALPLHFRMGFRYAYPHDDRP